MKNIKLFDRNVVDAAKLFPLKLNFVATSIENIVMNKL